MTMEMETLNETASVAVEREKSKKRGFTLTEIAIVLGIVGLILGAIWVAAAAVYNNLRVAHANTAILQIAQATRTLYATSTAMGGAAGDNTSNMVSANVIPSDLINGTTALSVWSGGNTYVGWNNTTDSAFTIQMTNVPQAACINLLTVVGGTNRDQGLVNVQSTKASAPVTAGQATTFPAPGTAQVAVITPSIATVACSAATNMVGFTFTLK